MKKNPNYHSDEPSYICALTGQVELLDRQNQTKPDPRNEPWLDASQPENIDLPYLPPLPVKRRTMLELTIHETLLDVGLTEGHAEIITDAIQRRLCGMTLGEIIQRN